LGAERPGIDFFLNCPSKVEMRKQVLWDIVQRSRLLADRMNPEPDAELAFSGVGARVENLGNTSGKSQ
jgi:hypothetical protein